ncbi:MAG: tetratricopeptide repeat protein [Myxococcales bacterium]|nr:tetratricopeptide repeat protein [Myxococcales bacterium]
MASEGKTPDESGIPADDWNAAIDEWDAHLDELIVETRSETPGGAPALEQDAPTITPLPPAQAGPHPARDPLVGGASNAPPSTAGSLSAIEQQALADFDAEVAAFDRAGDPLVAPGAVGGAVADPVAFDLSREESFYDDISIDVLGPSLSGPEVVRDASSNDVSALLADLPSVDAALPPADPFDLLAPETVVARDPFEVIASDPLPGADFGAPESEPFEVIDSEPVSSDPFEVITADPEVAPESDAFEVVGEAPAFGDPFDEIVAAAVSLAPSLDPETPPVEEVVAEEPSSPTDAGADPLRVDSGVPALPDDASPPLSGLPSTLGPVALALPDIGEPPATTAEALAEWIALLDGERMLCGDSDRGAELAYAAGRAADRAGDRDGARRRYESALDTAPAMRMALRGLRRVAVAEGRLDDAQSLLEREAERATPAERPGLLLERAELLVAAGERDAARSVYQQIAEQVPLDLRVLSGLVDVTAGDGGGGEAWSAVAALAARVGDPALTALLRAEVGRLAEAAGDDEAARAGYRAAIEAAADCRPAAMGLLRIALRGPHLGDGGELAAAYQRALPLTAGALQGALVTQLARLRLAEEQAAVAVDLLVDAEDPIALDLLARSELAAGREEAAAATLDRLAAALGSADARIEVLLLAGEVHERAGRLHDAARHFERASGTVPTDLAAALGLDRVDRAIGDPVRLIDRARAAAQDIASAEAERIHAARLLCGLDRFDEAAAELDAALEANPLSQTALVERVEVALRLGNPAAAAQALSRAARAVAEAGDAETAALLGERAGRLHARSGDLAAALGELSRLVDGELATVARWHQQRLLAAAGRTGELVEALGLEAEGTVDAGWSAELWHRRGLAQGQLDGEAAAESQRRALALAPAHTPALLALAVRLAGGPGTGLGELVALHQGRLDGGDASDRPEAIALHLRIALLSEAIGDPAATAQACTDALTRFPEGDLRKGPHARAIEEMLVAATLAAGETGRAVEILARFADGEPIPEQRFADELRLAEWSELRLGRSDTATEHYRLALEVRHGSPLALPGLVRTLEASGRFAELGEMALAELREAPGVARRVAAYEQLARLDSERRGDPQSAFLSYESILEVDHAHHPTFRVLEKHYLKEQNWPELVHLYEQMGLTATDPQLATAVILDRALLRERVGGHSDDVDNDFRQALFKNGHCRPALQRVLAIGRTRRDSVITGELSLRLAESPGAEPGAAAIFLTRAAECLAELGRTDEAVERYQQAIARGHLPAMRGLMRLGLEREAFSAAAFGAEAAGKSLHDPGERARAWLVAGSIAEAELADPPRALAAFRAALSAQPGAREPFARARLILEASGDHAGLAGALQARVGVETDPALLRDLHLDLAAVYRDRLGDREQARQQLRQVLAVEGGHAGALTALSDLCYADQLWPEAADALIRRARVERTPAVLKDVFFRLGLIYADHTPDAKRAIVSFTRVLQFETDHRTAIEYLSDLHLKEREWKGALGATSRLAELETDPLRRIAHLHRVASIYEEGFHDPRNAHGALRKALEVDPHSIPAIGQLAKYYERQGDATSARVHLDRSAQAVRAVLAGDPFDKAAYHSLFRILSWRRSVDQAFTVAGLLQGMGEADAEEKGLLAQLGGRATGAGSALHDIALDDQLFHPAIPAGFRHLFRLLDEPLQKLMRSDPRRTGLNKAEKLPRSGHAIRDLAARLAADIGLRDFDLYVSALVPTALTVELTDPISIIIGEKLVTGAHEQEVRFHLAGVMRMIRSQMAVPLHASPDELGVLVGGIVRQFVSDFVPAGFEEGPIAAEAARLAKVVPKKLHNEAMPFALECADPALDLRALSHALTFTAQRAGLLAVGSIGPALAALRRRGDDAQVRELLRFAITDELAELRRAVGIAVG